MLYGDWGTSRLYVLGLAFALAGHGSIYYIVAVSVLMVFVGWAYTHICRIFPDGGGVYSAAKQTSQLLAVVGALNSAVSLYYYMRIARAMFLEAPVGEVAVRPHLGYQIMLGVFSAALLLFGVWWNPLVDWTQQSLVFLRG